MLGRALSRAFDQMWDPAFRRVLILGLFITAMVFAAIFALGLYLAPALPSTGMDWLDAVIEGSAIIAFFLIFYFLFPAVSTMVMSLFLDDIAKAVEDKYYPENRAMRKISIGEEFMLSARFGLTVIGFNILALPVYVILSVTGVGGFIVFFLLNSYLLGREYFELIAIRHFLTEDVKHIRRKRRDKVLLAGAIITGLFLVPVVNLAAPIIATALMVHIFHESVLGKGKI